jgi:hypothetical protein
MKIDEAKWDALVAEHGDAIEIVSLPEHGFENVFRPPSSAAFASYAVGQHEAAEDGKKLTELNRWYVAEHCVGDRSELADFQERFPVALGRIALEINRMGGGAGKVIRKKFERPKKA